MKTCKKCSVEKPLDQYCIKKDTPDGYHIYCRGCRSEKHKVEYVNNKEVNGDTIIKLEKTPYKLLRKLHDLLVLHYKLP
jgi:hypothetical protein